MLSVAELQNIAKARLVEAEVLFANGQYDGAVYLCGYAVEVTLKARSCLTLGWLDFPKSAAEFKGLASFKTHELKTLLRLTGRGDFILQNYALDWAVIEKWDPESRYSPPGNTSRAAALLMIDSAKALMGVL